MSIEEIVSFWLGRAVLALVAVVALRWLWNNWGCAMGDHADDVVIDWHSQLTLERRCRWCGDVRKVERCSSCKSVWKSRHLEGCKLSEGGAA